MPNKLSLQPEDNGGIDPFYKEFHPQMPTNGADISRFKMYEDDGSHELTPEGKRYLQSKNKMLEVEEHVAAIVRHLNVMGGGKEVYFGIARSLMKSHRTLQQSFANIALRAIIDFFAHLDENGFTDARNEASANLGKALKAVMDEHHLPFI